MLYFPHRDSQVEQMENSGHFGHPFRVIPDTNSRSIRTVLTSKPELILKYFDSYSSKESEIFQHLSIFSKYLANTVNDTTGQ